jgi:hypothetical protein
MDVNVGSFEKNHGRIQAIVCNHAAHQNSIQMAMENETSHVQIVIYDSQFSKTYQLIIIESIRFQNIENQIKVGANFLRCTKILS